MVDRDGRLEYTALKCYDTRGRTDTEVGHWYTITSVADWSKSGYMLTELSIRGNAVYIRPPTKV